MDGFDEICPVEPGRHGGDGVDTVDFLKLLAKLGPCR